MSEAIRLSRRAPTERTLHGPAVTAAAVAGAAVPQVAVKVRGMASPGFAGSAVVLNQESLAVGHSLLVRLSTAMNGVGRVAVGQKLALANGGQKALLVRQERCLLGRVPRPKTDRGGHTRTQSCCSGRLFAKTARANWRRTAAKGGQNGGSRGARRERRGKRGQSSVGSSQ